MTCTGDEGWPENAGKVREDLSRMTPDPDLLADIEAARDAAGSIWDNPFQTFETPRCQVDAPEVREAPRRRPLSARSRTALMDALLTRSIEALHGQERARTAARLRLLRASDDPARLIRDWWGGTAPKVVDGGTSLVALAFRPDDGALRYRLDIRVAEYLRDPADLAAAILTERTIQGLTADELAAKADTTPSAIRALESGRSVKLRTTRRVLRQLSIEATALPSRGREKA